MQKASTESVYSDFFVLAVFARGELSKRFRVTSESRGNHERIFAQEMVTSSAEG